jgi:anti-sigma-K factor RskA
VSAGHDDRFRDDAAAWVLGALPEEEAATFAAHLEGCAACRAEVDHLRAAADALPASVPAVPPPPELKDRIMAVVAAEAEVLRAAGPAADRPAPAPRRRRWLPSLRPATVGFAVALLVAGLAAGLGLSRLAGGDDARVVRAQVSAPGAQATLRVEDGDGRLEVRGLPAPPEGRIYQVWLLRDGEDAPQPTTTLFSVTDGGRGAAEVPDVEGVEAVLVSAEPLGGSAAPTTTPIITAPLA